MLGRHQARPSRDLQQHAGQYELLISREHYQGNIFSISCYCTARMPGIVETMSTQGLFLLGGSVAFDAAAEAFVPAAGGAQAAIALLLQGGNNWQDYVPQYVEPWIQRGVTRYYPIVPREDGTLDLDAAAATLRAATGIFVGGGHTPTYRRLYAVEPIRSIIRDRYQQGVPYAGVSAGALIAPEICAIPPEDTGEPAVQVPPGLGLIRDVIVGVHFTEWNALPHVLEAMSQTQPTKAWGIDEDDCALFEGGQFKRALGGSVYEIRMTDSAAQTYQITEHRAPG